MLTTVRPCVAVNDGVCDLELKIHLRSVKAQYTQTWWLRPPPFHVKGLRDHLMHCVFARLYLMYYVPYLNYRTCCVPQKIWPTIIFLMISALCSVLSRIHL